MKKNSFMLWARLFVDLEKEVPQQIKCSSTHLVYVYQLIMCTLSAGISPGTVGTKVKQIDPANKTYGIEIRNRNRLMFSFQFPLSQQTEL